MDQSELSPSQARHEPVSSSVLRALEDGQHHHVVRSSEHLIGSPVLQSNREYHDFSFIREISQKKSESRIDFVTCDVVIAGATAVPLLAHCVFPGSVSAVYRGALGGGRHGGQDQQVQQEPPGPGQSLPPLALRPQH